MDHTPNTPENPNDWVVPNGQRYKVQHLAPTPHRTKRLALEEMLNAGSEQGWRFVGCVPDGTLGDELPDMVVFERD